MKVLFYNHTGQVGGAERLLLTFLERLDQSEFAPVLICPVEGPLHRLAAQRGLRTETVDGLKARFTWRLDHLAAYLNSIRRLVRQLRQKVTEIQPDLIHANSVRAGLVATLATIGLEQVVIWHIHDLLPRHPLTVVIRAIALASRRTRVIAVAKASASRLTGNVQSLQRRTTVIPNAVDFDRFVTNCGGREQIRHELDVEEDAPLVGMIGRLTPPKGQLEMLKLFPKILNRFPNARLVIVGAPAFNNEHEYQQLLKQTVVEMNLSERVRMLGARDDVDGILRALDLLVVNSASEACSLVILEAMAGGTPILATSTGGTPEIIEHQTNGWLVNFGQSEELLDGVTTMLSDRALRERVSSQARQDASVRYTIPRLMNEMEDFYRAVLAKGKVPHQKNLPQFTVSLSPD